jgi:SAM-dependent methyltransferase
MAIHRIVKSSNLLGFEGIEFIDQAYRAILGRTPDEAGRDHFLKELRSGKSKHAILQILADSPEGVNVGVELDERYRSGAQVARIPMLGRIASFFSDLIRMPSTVMELHRQLKAVVAMRAQLESLDGAIRARFATLDLAIEQLSEQLGSLSRFALTELVQSNTISYLTSFIDVRQKRLSMQLASTSQSISEELRQVVERTGQGFNWLLSTSSSSQNLAMERLLEALVQEIRANGTEKAFEALSAGLQKTGSDIEVRLAAMGDTLNRFLTILDGLQNGKISTPDDVFRSQIGTSVDQLSAAAAEYLNWATGHTGYSGQKNVWMNHPFGALHTNEDVTLGYINERILEVPYVFARAMKLPIGSRILDCGCCESWVGPALAQFGYNVIGVDVRPYPIPAPNFMFVRAAMEEWNGPAEPFDAILSLSSLEHFGLGAYGGPQSGEHTDRALLAKMAGWLKPSGVLIFTAPYGPWSINEFQRVYDAAALKDLLSGWNIEEAYYFYTLDGTIWTQSDKSLDTQSFPTSGRAVVMLQARRAV